MGAGLDRGGHDRAAGVDGGAPACGATEMEMEAWDRWARAQLAGGGLEEEDEHCPSSRGCQRGNARIILSGAARARSGRGVRVYGHMSSSDLDTGAAGD